MEKIAYTCPFCGEIVELYEGFAIICKTTKRKVSHAFQPLPE